MFECNFFDFEAMVSNTALLAERARRGEYRIISIGLLLLDFGARSLILLLLLLLDFDTRSVILLPFCHDLIDGTL